MSTPAAVVFEAVALVNDWHAQAQEHARPAHGAEPGRGGLRDLTAGPED